MFYRSTGWAKTGHCNVVLLVSLNMNLLLSIYVDFMLMGYSGYQPVINVHIKVKGHVYVLQSWWLCACEWSGKMRLRLTVERGLILSTALFIISLQLVILWSDRQSTTTATQSTKSPTPDLGLYTVHQQPQRTEKMNKPDDAGNGNV